MNVAKDAACTWSLCSIRSGSTNGINCSLPTGKWAQLPFFGASRPLEPAEWLALLILKAGDVESNPGPQNRKLPPSALTTQTTTLNSTTHSHAATSLHNQKLLTLLQININSITNKHEELKLLVTELQPDIITIQETKLKKHNKTPQIPTYSAICTDRANGKGGGLLTYIKHNITFSDTKIPNFINPINTELQIIQLHITNSFNTNNKYKYIIIIIMQTPLINNSLTRSHTLQTKQIGRLTNKFINYLRLHLY